MVRVHLDVHDTGVGVEAEAKDKLFQKFQQADGSITRRFGGTGLGLSICRELIQLMGGKIGVVDSAQGGSTFWFEIDLPRGAALKPKAKPTSLKGARILVVDDIELNRSIFVRQLQAEGALVEEASSGGGGLEAVSRAEAAGVPYDIVLLDHMMPDIAGDTVAELIRAHAAWRQPKLVLASSVGAPLKSDRAAKAGFDAFLTKPIRHNALVDCLAGLGRASVPAAQRIEATPAPTRGVRARILLAEDNEINALLTITLLEGEGYQVERAVNGKEAVEAVSGALFDMILMDIQMPVMDGLEATQAIRAMGGAAGRTPILAMTANARASDRDDCLTAGVDDFVAKPIELNAFLQIVARHLKSAPRAAAAAAEGPEFDREQLDGLVKLMPAAGFRQVVEAYLLTASRGVDRLAAALAEDDLKTAQAEAHDLKGSSGNFGCRRVQALSDGLENACRDDDAEAAGTLLEALQLATASAWAMLRQRADALQPEVAA
jgi:CheY-like chemotaxis protein/HPt (histidine-containing phosphotransfer) domain-containing protein